MHQGLLSLTTPHGSANEYQLWLGRQRQVQLILLVDEMQGVQVKLCYPLTMRAIPERLKRRFVWRRYTNRLPLPIPISDSWLPVIFCRWCCDTAVWVSENATGLYKILLNHNSFPGENCGVSSLTECYHGKIGLLDKIQGKEVCICVCVCMPLFHKFIFAI